MGFAESFLGADESPIVAAHVISVVHRQSAFLHLLAKLVDLVLLALERALLALDRVHQLSGVGGAEWRRLAPAFPALAVPSCPWALTTTGWAVAETVLPLIPAM